MVARGALRHWAVRLWLRVSRASHRLRRGGDVRVDQHRLVEELAPGRSFIDVGGMFDIAGDVSFRAERAGAKRVVLFDGMDPSLEFQKRHRETASEVRYVQADLHNLADVERVGRFDVVWCSGVIYHSPNPYLQLCHLRRMTNERLVFGTHVIPEVPGLEQACVFYPGMGRGQREAFAAAHGERAASYPGMTSPFDKTPLMGYANMWWGLTPSAVRAMLAHAGFEIEREYRPSWYLMHVVARASTPPDFIPPPDFSRARERETAASLPGADWIGVE